MEEKKENKALENSFNKKWKFQNKKNFDNKNLLNLKEIVISLKRILNRQKKTWRQ